jgi:5-methylcytosine-specific restriction endonuclease McrA
VPVVINCKRCGKEIWVKPSQLGKKSYCSRECMTEAYTKLRAKRTCKMCGKEFEFPDRPSRQNAMFCNRECMDKYYVGERHRMYSEDSWDNNIDKRREYNRKYQEENKEKILHNAYKGKLKRRKQIEPDHTFQEWIDLLKKHDNKCYYCGARMTKKPGLKQRTRDHIIPVTKGGKDEISNIVPACRSCNSQKGARTYEEWKGVTVIETASTDDKGVE